LKRGKNAGGAGQVKATENKGKKSNGEFCAVPGELLVECRKKTHKGNTMILEHGL